MDVLLTAHLFCVAENAGDLSCFDLLTAPSEGWSSRYYALIRILASKKVRPNSNVKYKFGLMEDAQKTHVTCRYLTLEASRCDHDIIEIRPLVLGSKWISLNQEKQKTKWPQMYYKFVAHCLKCETNWKNDIVWLPRRAKEGGPGFTVFAHALTLLCILVNRLKELNRLGQ